MSDSAHDAHGDHSEPHLPPNSFVPVVLALTLTWTLVGFVIGPVVWGTGLVALILTLIQWYRAARNEFAELPD